MSPIQCSIAFFFLGLAVAGCTGQGRSPEGFPVPDIEDADRSGANSSRKFVSYDQMLSSNTDGATIAFTVHEPDEVVVGEAYPLVLSSHGYGGRRQSIRPTEGLPARLLGSGYGVVSIDQRGHGAFTDGSGGTIRVLDPNYEGQDLLQILDWAEANIDWLMYRNGNPVIGSVGGSYRGGYQNLIYRIDPMRRLDAMVPDVTWYDLRYSLMPGGAYKTFWTTLVGAVGNTPGNNVDPQIQQAIAQGVLTNSFHSTTLDLFYNNSLVSNCEGNRPDDPALTPVNALFTQSVIDQLFNFNEAVRSYECLNGLGGDVRLFMKPNGHVGAPHSRCGGLEVDDATLAFFEEHLKGVAGAADLVPEICYQLDNADALSTDAVVVDSVQVGGTTTPEVSANGLTLFTASNAVTNIPLLRLDEASDPGGDGDILAGIPTIDLSVMSPAQAVDALEPIVFIGLSRSTDGGATWTNLHDQVRPFRGFGDFHEELVGVLQRFDHGDLIGLEIRHGEPAQFGTSGSNPPAIANVKATVHLPLIGTKHPMPVASP